MKWELSTRNGLLCTRTDENELAEFKRFTDVFLGLCASSYPGVDRRLRENLRNMKESLRPSCLCHVVFKKAAIERLLRWCITDGQHLQDSRRECARQIWGVLFRGEFPRFLQGKPLDGTYEFRAQEFESWLRLQIAQPVPDSAAD